MFPWSLVEYFVNFNRAMRVKLVCGIQGCSPHAWLEVQDGKTEQELVLDLTISQISNDFKKLPTEESRCVYYLHKERCTCQHIPSKNVVTTKNDLRVIKSLLAPHFCLNSNPLVP